MMRNDLKRGGLWLAVIVLGALPGCGTESDLNARSEGMGSVQLALTAQAGSSYHLANVVVRLTGASRATLTGDDPILRQDLPVGDYLARLEDGWTLNTIGADRTENPVDATLVSRNPLSFTIESGQITHLSFEFSVGGTPIKMGDGSVAVSVKVDDNKIDDFEDGDNQILEIAGRSGHWFAFNDGTSGVQVPSPNTPVLPVDGPGGDLVLHTAGAGFTSFGAAVGATLASGATGALPCNAAGYRGVRFAYTSKDFNQVVFRVATSATAPIPGGTCDPAIGACYDDFNARIFLYPTESPLTVEVRWEQLSQGGWGIPVTFDPTTLLALIWQVSNPTFGPPVIPPQPGPAFDFTLDDIEFIQ